MPFQPSTPWEVRRAAALVRMTGRRIRRLAEAGKKVHVIWDVDHVLVSGRSEDAFGLLKFDVEKYFAHEERLLLEILEDGPWLRLARACGTLFQSQDVVTARSSFLALRVTFFLVQHQLPIRWQLFVGHQSKAESYRIILKSFEKDPDMHVFSVDDAKKHNDAFDAIAAELGMSARCHSVLAPQIRRHTQEDLEYEIAQIMRVSGAEPKIIPPRVHVAGAYNRYVRVVPDARKIISDMLWNGSRQAEDRAFIDQHRAALEKLAAEHFPGQPITDELLLVFRDMGMPP